MDGFIRIVESAVMDMKHKQREKKPLIAAQQLIIIVLFLYPIKSNIGGAFNNILHIFDKRGSSFQAHFLTLLCGNLRCAASALMPMLWWAERADPESDALSFYV